MPVTLYYGSGSPYAWRVWLALEHKNIAYELKTLSFDKKEHKQQSFLALNPRGKVPVFVDDGFALYESSAIVEYIAERWPEGPGLFAADPQRRAVQRRMIGEADQYAAEALDGLVDVALRTPAAERSEQRMAEARAGLKQEFAYWEAAIEGDYLTGALSAADFALYPLLALAQRLDSRNPGLLGPDSFGPKIQAWQQRMAALPITRKTWPPHWR